MKLCSVNKRKRGFTLIELPVVRKRRSYGFTLIELLVVIAIIGILAGLLLPGVTAVRRAARRKKAAAQAKAIVHAVKSYRTAYGKWPGQIQGANDRTYPDCANIITELINNPRQMLFIEIPGDALTNGYYADPWGESYIIAMDENNDGDVTIEAGYFTNTIANETVAVASLGRDPADTSMRIYSWK